MKHQRQNQQTGVSSRTLCTPAKASRPSGAWGTAASKLCLGLAIALAWHGQSWGAAKTWVGGAATNPNDWNTAANWNPAAVPTSGDDVTVPSNATAFPILRTSAANSVQTVTINAGGTLTVVSGGSLVTLHGAASLKVDGTLTMSGGTITVFQDITGAGTTSMTGGTLQIGHDWHLAPSQFSATGGTVEWTGEVGNAGPGGFPGGSGAYQFFNVLVDAGVDPGFDNQANSFTITGNWTNNGNASLNQRVTTVTFAGTGPQIIAGSVLTTFNKLAINDNAGVTLAATASVAGSLTFTRGVLATGTNAVSLAASTTVTGASASTYVNGSVIKAFNAGNGQAFSFPVGDAATFAPVGLASLNVKTGGSLSARTRSGQHPQILSSGINPSRDAARYWTLSNASGGIAVSSCSATFNFATSDLGAGAVATSFTAKRYAGAWFTNANVTAASTSTSIAALASFGDFAVGQIGSAPPVLTYCRVQPDRTALIGFTGAANTTYTILASADLASWANIGTSMTGADGTGEYHDSSAPGLPIRLYRAVYP